MVARHRPFMSFDTLAPYYRWMEFFLAGEKLQQCRTMFLGEICNARNILLLGEGHGRGLVECCRRFPLARITCVDSSRQMLATARRQLTKENLHENRIEFIHADVLTWPPTGNCYDLVVTNFFLDCFRPDQLEQVIAKVGKAAAPDAHWLIADFQLASTNLKRIRTRVILGMMYAFFRVVVRLPARQLTPPEPLLRKAGFILHKRIETEWGLL